MIVYFTKDPVDQGLNNYHAPENKPLNWYPPVEEVRPRVYHKYVNKNSPIYTDLYPDLVEVGVKSISDISKAINESVDDVIEVKLAADIEVPVRDDGKITTIFVPKGKTLKVDLNGHEYKCVAYAFYVYGSLVITDSSSSKKGVIRTTNHNTYAAIMAIGEEASVYMDAGTINTLTPEDTETANWMYGVVCMNGATATITGSTNIITDEASCLSTNNTTGQGHFYVAGDAKLSAKKCSAIYQASMDIIDIKDNAVVNGGIIARMGHITVSGKAKVINNGFEGGYDDFGAYLPTGNGPAALQYALFHAAGTYKGNGEAGSNDLVFTVKDNAVVKSNDSVAVMVADLGTGFDQVSKINLKDDKVDWQVLSYDEAKEIVTASGKTLGAKKATTDITVTVGGAVVYPVGTEGTVTPPSEITEEDDF